MFHLHNDLPALDTPVDQSTVAAGPQASQPDHGTPPTVTSTPSSALPGVAGPSKATAAAPPRAKQTLKKEPVRKCLPLPSPVAHLVYVGFLVYFLYL